MQAHRAGGGVGSVSQECDWCGKPIIGEQPVPGIDGAPTHRACRRQIRRSERMSPYYDPDRHCVADEREPFIDWPNGQGEAA